MAIISSDEITLVRVDDGADGDDGYSPQVTVTQNQQDQDSVDINVTTKDNSTGIISTTSTPIKKADRIYTALQDLTTFNTLTNNGDLQGIFVSQNGRAYFNGTYLRAEGADIGGYHIEDKMMWAFANHEYEVEDPNDPNATIEEVAPRFTVINGKAEFYDQVNAENVNEYYDSLNEVTAPATPAFAAGIDGVISYDSETNDTTIEMSDINTARTKIMHDGSIFAGRYLWGGGQDYDYNFKVFADGTVFVGQNGVGIAIDADESPTRNYPNALPFLVMQGQGNNVKVKAGAGGAVSLDSDDVLIDSDRLQIYRKHVGSSPSDPFQAYSSLEMTGGDANNNSGEIHKEVLRAYNGLNEGIGVILGAGGTTIISAGEAGVNLVETNDPGGVLDGVNNCRPGNSESLHLAADGAIYFYSNCNTIANRKEMKFWTDGVLTVPENIKIGSNNLNPSDYVTVSGTNINSSNVLEGTIKYYIHGNLCTVIFEDVKFSAVAHGRSAATKNSADLVASGFPIPKSARTFVTTPYGTTFSSARMQLLRDGKLYFHYSGTPTATMQHYGEFTYIIE